MIIIIVDGHQEAVSLQAICLPAWFPHIASPNSFLGHQGGHQATKAVLPSFVVIATAIIIQVRAAITIP